MDIFIKVHNKEYDNKEVNDLLYCACINFLNSETNIKTYSKFHSYPIIQYTPVTNLDLFRNVTNFKELEDKSIEFIKNYLLQKECFLKLIFLKFIYLILILNQNQ